MLEGDTGVLRRRSRGRRRAEDRRSRRQGDGRRFDYPHYYFLNLVTDAGGGLEHKNSFLAMSGRFTTRTPRRVSALARAWSRTSTSTTGTSSGCARSSSDRSTTRTKCTPRRCGSREGFTDYYAGLLVKRAGLSTRDEYLEELSEQIEAVQTTPGRLVTSVDMASYDTWIKQYRPDENTANTTINYYPKGAVIAFLLDAQHPPRDQRKPSRWTMRCGSPISATPAPRATRSSSSTRR